MSKARSFCFLPHCPTCGRLWSSQEVDPGGWSLRQPLCVLATLSRADGLLRMLRRGARFRPGPYHHMRSGPHHARQRPCGQRRSSPGISKPHGLHKKEQLMELFRLSDSSPCYIWPLNLTDSVTIKPICYVMQHGNQMATDTSPW